MKKFLSMIAAVSLLAASLSACGASSTTSTTAAAESGKEYKVAIVQQLDHASLDEIRWPLRPSWRPRPQKRA